MPIEYGYGCFPGGDPRSFSPDEECCTPEELAKHKADCEAWDRGENPAVPISGWISPNIHVLRSSYGLGVYRKRGKLNEI